MTFLEQIRVRMAAKEFHDVPEFLICWLISDGKDFLEMLVGGPHLVASEIDALVQSMSTRHALEVNAVKFTASSEGKVISNLVHLFKG